jgi:hypothetical protein
LHNVDLARVLTIKQIIVENADKFVVTDLRVGRNSQHPSGGALPGSLFSEESVYRLTFDQLVKGDYVEVCVTNITKELVKFSVVAWCEESTAMDGEVANYRRTTAIGLGRTAIQPKSHANISVQPSFTGDLHHLVVPAWAHDFDVLRVVMGKEVVWCPSSGAMACPSSEFSEEIDYSDNPTWPNGLSVSAEGGFVTIEVRNRSSEVRWFGGALVGTVRG